MRLKRRMHPLLVLFILFLLCAVAWAVAELSGQANKSAADAGMASADLEMASLETISKPAQTPPNVNWEEERRLRRELERQDDAYKSVAAQARQQSSSPEGVNERTAASLRAAAAKFKSTSDLYADVWDKGNCRSRARLAREAGASRVASAEVIIAGADSGKIDALNRQQAQLNKARQDYIKEAKANNEFTDADKAAIKANLMPKAKQLVSDTGALVSQVAKLLDQIRAQATPAGLVGGLSGCAASSVGSGSGAGAGAAGDSAATLLSPVTSLLSLSKGLAGNAASLVDDLTGLSK